jgi:hypothetical protein
MVCYKKIDVTVLMVFVLKSTIGYLIIGMVDQQVDKWNCFKRYSTVGNPQIELKAVGKSV